jgi:predicted dienelactone hydrolase
LTKRGLGGEGDAVRSLLSILAAVLSLVRLAGAAEDYTTHGPFPVGVTMIELTTTSVTSGEPRVLATQVWYPAATGTGTVEGPVFRDADVAKGRFPLVVFSHGSCGIPNQSPFLMETLASRGFVLAAPPHPGNTFSATCMTPEALADAFANRPADVIFVAETFLGFGRDKGSRFHRHVHPKRLGVAGHSFGGQTTLRVAAMDRRFRAALALAPVRVPDATIRAPLMVMTGELDSLTPFEEDAVPSYGIGTGPRFLVEILATGHCAFIPLCAAQFCGVGCDPPALSPPDANHLVLRYAVPFLQRYLKGDRAAGRALRPSEAPAGIVLETDVGKRR